MYVGKRFHVIIFLLAVTVPSILSGVPRIGDWLRNWDGDWLRNTLGSRFKMNLRDRFYLSKLQPDPNPESDSYYCILGFKDTHSAVGPACLVLFYILPSTAYSAMSFGLNYLVKKRKRESFILRKDQSVSTQKNSSDKYDKYYLDVIKYGFRDAGKNGVQLELSIPAATTLTWHWYWI